MSSCVVSMHSVMRYAGGVVRHAAADNAFETSDAGSRPVEQDSDQALIASSLDRNERSFARLIERYESGAASVLWHFTRDPAVLDELVQDTFVEVYFSLGRFRAGAPFLPWLRAIATRVGYGYWRRQRRESARRGALDVWHRESPPPSAPHEARELAEYVYGLLALLGPKDRLVLTLQYFEGCTMQEIAKRMGWSVSLVKVRAFRARKRLRTLLPEKE